MNDDKLGNNSSTDYSTQMLLYQLGIENIDYGKRVNVIQDTSSTSEGTQVKLGVYTSLPGNPKLVNPSPDTNPSGFDHINNALQNFPDQILSFFNSLPTPETDEFPEDLDNAIADVPEETLAQIGDGDPQKGAAMLRFAALHPDVNVPPNVATLAQSVLGQATQQAGHGPSALLVSIEDAGANALAQYNFQNVVAGMGLSEADQKALYFANSVSSAVAQLSPTLQAALKSAQNTALTQTANTVGCPPGWISPSDGKALQTKIGKQLTTNVTNTLSQQLLNGQITKSQYNEMRTLFFLPDADTPNQATLQPMLNAIVGQANQGLQQIYGFPNGYTPPINPAGYNGILNCTFSANFKTLLGNQSPALTQQQQTLLQQALLSSTAEDALPPDLKAIFENLKGAAIAQLSKTYGVPLTWTPDSTVLATAAVKSAQPGTVQAQTVLNQGKEWLSNAKQALNTYSLSTGAAGGGGGGGPGLVVLIKDYMKVVAQALSGMQEMLYELSTTDANMAEMMNKIQNDAKIGQLKKQAAQLQQVLAEQKKMDSLGPLKAIFQWLIMLILVMFLGPAGLAMATMLMATMLVQSAKQLAEGDSFQKILGNMNFIDDLAKTLSDIGNSIGGPFGQMFAHATTLLTLLTMAVLAPELVTADLMVGSGSFVKDGLEAVGVPEQQAQMAAMIVQMAAQILIGIVLAVITGGASIAAAAVTFAKTVAQTTENVIRTVWDALKTFVMNTLATLGIISQDAAAEAIESATNTTTSAIKSFLDACDDTIEGLNKFEDLAEAAETAAKKVDDATKNLKTCEEALKGLEGNYATPQEAADAAAAGDKALKTAQSAVEDAQNALKDANEAYDVAKKAFDDAYSDSVQLQEKMSSYIEKAHTITDAVEQVTQAIPNIQNNIIQAQIDRIKANMDATMVTVEQFCKLLIALVQKLMDGASNAGQDIKDISSSLQNLFQSSESVLSNLASARG